MDQILGTSCSVSGNMSEIQAMAKTDRVHGRGVQNRAFQVALRLFGHVRQLAQDQLKVKLLRCWRPADGASPVPF
eukprot:s6807_g1.t1